jgi:hypothetical protein
VVVLSDHGQSEGPTFKGAHGLSLEDLVKGLIKGDQAVIALTDSSEGWDHINAMLSESVNGDTRTARLMRNMLKSRTQADGHVEAGPEAAQRVAEQQAASANVIVLGSGCTGLVYFSDSADRLTYEAIQERYPELLMGLVQHPGIGFVMVRSETDGALVMGREGVRFLDLDTVEGTDPLAAYGPNAARHLKRESGFSNCPDLVVNSRYDATTQELCGFENQVSHHGGLGGPQNHAFVFHPRALAAPDEPLVWAPAVYRLLRTWRDQAIESGSRAASQVSV